MNPEPSILSLERLARGLYWDRAWSLVDGCSPCDEECRHCWAAGEAHMRAGNPCPAIRERYAGLTNADGSFNGTVRIHEELLPKPIRAVKPAVWSIWTDLLHELVPDRFIGEALDVIADARSTQHRFLICTKRPERWGAIFQWFDDQPAYTAFTEMWELAPWDIPMLVGTTVGHQQAIHRARALLDSPLVDAVPLFLSIEPLLGRLRLPPPILDRFRWAVIGCESGHYRRPCELAWVQDVVDQLQAAGVRVFIKQLAIAGSVVRSIERFPRGLQLRELPRGFISPTAQRA